MSSSFWQVPRLGGTMRDRFYAVLTMIVGVVLLVGGIITLIDGGPAGTVMEPGTSTGLPLDGRERDPANTGWLLVGGGVLALLCGVFWAYAQFFGRKSGQETAGWPDAG
jgi:amino acid transporter